MINHTRRILLSTVAGLAMVGAVPVWSAPAMDVQSLQENWRKAMVAADVPALEAMYSDGLVYVHSDGRIQTKQQFLAPMKAGTMRFAALNGCDEPRIRTFDASAIVSACYELKAGSGAASRHLFLTVYASEAGKWRIVAQQTTRLPDK